MGHRGLSRVTGLVAALVCGLAVLAPPGRFMVDGLSMAPGLLPGDVVASRWFPALDRLTAPRRHERWILTTPDGTLAIKRIAGLPGETVSIRDGDLAIGGRTVLKPPHVLAELASPVPEAVIVAGGDGAADGRWQRTVSVADVLDDAAFAPAERRMLVPVRDVGLAAVIHLREAPAKGEAVRVRVRVGDAVVPWRISASGRFAVVAGRLDGQLVGAAWPIAAAVGGPADTRRPLPSHAPEAWGLAVPWPAEPSSDAGSRPPTLALGLAVNDIPMARSDADAVIEQVVSWRDMLHRPAADGVEEWRLGCDAFLALGDFPSGSRDSRHWGPLGRGAFRHRAQPSE